MIQWQKKIKAFARERDWEQFHNPKNISMALSVECSELLELFQWIDQSDLKSLKQSLDFENFKQKVNDEVADIFFYWLRFCDLMEIDIPKALEQKMIKNGEKYPVEKARGKATKYTDL